MTMTDKHLAELDLDLLMTLEALLRARQVSGAAYALGTNQPTVSRRLKRLRVVFSDPLLIRGRLTPRAESMQEPLQTIFASMRAMVCAPDARH
jgi:DNA-binding transcriptional LysR family regulator